MGNSWKYAQTLQFPQSDLCECGHYRKDHNNMKGCCILCMDHGKLKDISDSPPDDVLGFLVGEREKCEKFRKWSVERVRAFWEIANVALNFNTNTEQTILDDFYPISNIHEYHR